MSLIVTHDGLFHADEVFACAALQLVAPEARILRTRDAAYFEKAACVVDVGFKHDGVKFFDHHQREGAGARENGVSYASAGLVWKAFGTRVARACGVGASQCEDVANYIDKRLIEGIDALDCGELITHAHANGVPVQQYSISHLISAMNGDEGGFDAAVKVAKRLLRYLVEERVDALTDIAYIRENAPKALDQRILVFDRFVRWQEVVCTEFPSARYVVLPNLTGAWTAIAVPQTPGSFKTIKPFPGAWGGLEHAPLVAATGVEDAVFCHKNLFLCVAKTRDAAYKLTELALRT